MAFGRTKPSPYSPSAKLLQAEDSTHSNPSSSDDASSSNESSPRRTGAGSTRKCGRARRQSGGEHQSDGSADFLARLALAERKDALRSVSFRFPLDDRADLAAPNEENVARWLAQRQQSELCEHRAVQRPYSSSPASAVSPPASATGRGSRRVRKHHRSVEPPIWSDARDNHIRLKRVQHYGSLDPKHRGDAVLGVARSLPPSVSIATTHKATGEHAPSTEAAERLRRFAWHQHRQAERDEIQWVLEEDYKIVSIVQ